MIRALPPKICVLSVSSFSMKRLLPIFLTLTFSAMLPLSLSGAEVSFRNHVQLILAKAGLSLIHI